MSPSWRNMEAASAPVPPPQLLPLPDNLLRPQPGPRSSVGFSSEAPVISSTLPAASRSLLFHHHQPNIYSLKTQRLCLVYRLRPRSWPWQQIPFSFLSTAAWLGEGCFGWKTKGISKKQKPKPSPLTLIRFLPICLFILLSPQISTKLLWSLLNPTYFSKTIQTNGTTVPSDFSD